MKIDSKKRRDIIFSVIGALILTALVSVVVYSIAFLKKTAETILEDGGGQQKQITRYNFEKLESLNIIQKEEPPQPPAEAEPASAEPEAEPPTE